MNWQASRFEVFEASRFETEEERILLVFVLVWFFWFHLQRAGSLRRGETALGRREHRLEHLARASSLARLFVFLSALLQLRGGTVRGRAGRGLLQPSSPRISTLCLTRKKPTK
jgi:hypothetical protein